MDQEEFFSSRLLDFCTLRDIADRVGEPISRVKMIVEKYHIQQARRVGVIRLWRVEDVVEIKRLISADIKTSLDS